MFNVKNILANCGYTFMSRNKQLRKYLIGRSYKNDEFDWPFDLMIVTYERITQTVIETRICLFYISQE